jgi:CMP-N-acetylneuraminic acid synthetase
MRILGVIPARSGSKGVPRKNIALLNGRPLIAYTIKSALDSTLLTDVVVSTDDEEIAEVSSKLGAQVPFLRPEELATDGAQTLPVLQHAVREMEAKTKVAYDIIVLLQPTCPMRSTEDIDAIIELIMRTGADSAVSVVDVGGYHPFRMKRIVGDNLLVNYIDQGFEDMRPRQSLPPVYIRSGDLYVTRRKTLMEDGALVGKDCRAYIISPERSLNIDTILDFKMAELLLSDENHGRNHLDISGEMQ